MNLPDLIRRSDRAVSLTAGRATPMVQDLRDESRSIVVMDPGTRLILKRANEFECLRRFPQDITWRIWRQKDQRSTSNGRGDFVTAALNEDPPAQSSTIFSARLEAGEMKRVVLDWPRWTNLRSSFDLQLMNDASVALALDSGANFNSRANLLPLIRGVGVEIGPGLNPQIMPSDAVDVRYVESAGAEEWVRNYKKTDKPSVAEQRNLWSKYIVADAQFLSEISDGSLNFIFSNHVFEHFMNPLGVLENWRRKLAPTGIVLGVVPDCRYTFDLRQTPDRDEEWLHEYANGIWKIGPAQYERWCMYTAPHNTPEDLVARNYSIHVHYYTSETFSELARLVVRWGLFESTRLETSPNHKDFGFVFTAG